MFQASMKGIKSLQAQVKPQLTINQGHKNHLEVIRKFEFDFNFI